jgi:hypothetical protein
MEKEFQRWTARRKVEVLLELIKGEAKLVDLCPDDPDDDSDGDGACVGPSFHAPATECGDPCSRTGGSGAWAKSKVRFKKLLAPAGEQRMLLKGEFPIPAGGPALAPSTHGLGSWR